MEVEEELHRQGMSQEEIDEQMEEIASNYQNEINKKQEEDPNVNEKLEKHDLESNEHNSSAEQCDQIELTSALSNEKKKESDEEENERLQELYRQETGKRPMYARQKSKGYSKWLEQRELEAEKINISRSESEKKKEIDEEDWKATLNQWIREASEEVCNAEFKSELKIVLDRKEFEDLIRKCFELDEKAQNEKLSEKEKKRLKSLRERVQKLDPIQLELLLSVFFIKKYITEQYWDDFWNIPLVNRLFSKFFKQISQKIIKFKKAQVKKENLEVLKLELDAIEIESKDKKDLLEEITKLGSEELDEEAWKTTLKQWIREASEEESNNELKSELKKALESYNEFEYLTRRFLELYEKSQYEKLSEKEKNRLKSLMGRLQELGPIQLELLANIRALKDYFYNHFWELMNRFFVNRVRSKFYKRISQIYKNLKKAQENKENSNIIKQVNSVLTIKKDHWKIIIDIIIHIYNELEDEKWSVSISQFNINIIMNKIFNKLKDNYNGLSNYVDFNANSKRVFSQLIKMTPLILNGANMKLGDLYKFVGHSSAKSLPDYLRELVKLFFETEMLYRAKFNLKTKEDFFKEYRLLAEERGWALLSKEYISNKIGLDFKCLKCNHEWHVRPSSLKDAPSQKGRGCPNCNKRLTYTIADMQKIASERGGWCLSENYINNKTRLKWECGKCNHKWWATPKSIMISDSWCPQCAEGLYERMCRAMFEKIFDKEFKKSYPSWLISEKGFQMHLDGDNEELCLCFEYQGEQHYRFIKFIHKTIEKFHDQQKLDIWKQNKCNENGRILIKIGFEMINGKLHKIRFNEMENSIRKKCIEHGIIPPNRISKINWRTLDISPPDKIQEMDEIAKSRNGFCLSKKYFGVNVKLEWECGNCNHKWWATPHNIKNGHWCKICGIQNMIKNRHLNSLIKNKN